VAVLRLTAMAALAGPGGTAAHRSPHTPCALNIDASLPVHQWHPSAWERPYRCRPTLDELERAFIEAVNVDLTIVIDHIANGRDRELQRLSRRLG